jgi:DNA repair protein RecO (recombination protein O)
MTMSARIDRQPAFVLHRRSYRESSLLLDLLTRDQGRVSVVARAARGGKRDWGALCQPFKPLLVGWSGQRELKTLTAAERAARGFEIRGARLYSALYANEILVRLLQPLDPHPALFDAYARLLEAMAQGGDLEPLLRIFEMQLLRELGYALELDREASSGLVLEPAAHYAYEPTQGLSLARSSDAANSYPGWVLAAIARADYSEAETRRVAKRLMRRALAELLGDKPLNSRAYFLSRAASSRS